eukprot:s148_g37.t1
MGPVGLWLPWSEVVQLAGRCGWSGEDCGVAANIWCGLQAVELDPCDGDERPAGPSQYRRVRLLPMHATDGVLDVSDSSDVEASAESPQPEPVLPPLDERPCVDAAPVDVKDARLLPLFFSMWTQHQSELLAGLDGGLRLDIPEWASELFRDGRGWTPEAAAGSAGKKPARWGRCSYPRVLRWNTEFGWLAQWRHMFHDAEKWDAAAEGSFNGRRAEDRRSHAQGLVPAAPPGRFDDAEANRSHPAEADCMTCAARSSCYHSASHADVLLRE